MKRTWPIPLPSYFWPIAQWRLGVGHYKGHKRDPRMRPKAPKRLPATFWAWWLYRFTPKSAEAKLRAKIISYWIWGVDNKAQIHYRQARPMEDLKNPSRLKALPRWADCSEFFTDGYAYAGAPDPNGLGYSGYGYTGTLLKNGKALSSASQLLPGDAVVYGSGTGNHVCGVLVAGKNPLLVSHGQEAGPIEIRLDEETAYHRNQTVTFLKFF